MKIQYVCLIIAIQIWSFASAQTETWSGYTTANTSTQLMNNYVNCINFDAKGKAWIGTDESGISVFDGKNWSNIIDIGNKKIFKTNCITKDAKGNIWVGTVDGFWKFDGFTWTNFSSSTTQGKFYHGSVWAIKVDSKENIWLATLHGLVKFDGSVFTTYKLSSDPNANRVTSLAIDSKDIIWAGTRNGLACKFDGTSFTNYNNVAGMEGYQIQSIGIDSENTKWLCTTGAGIFKFNDTTWTRVTKLDGLCGDVIMAMAIDSKGNKWFTTLDNGVCLLDSSGWHSFNQTNSEIASNSVNSVIIDNAENIWFGTDLGVSKYNGKTWTNLKSNGLPNNLIFDIEFDPDGSKWFATNNGISKFDGTRWYNYKQDLGVTHTSLSIDHLGNKWIGSYWGVSKFDDSTWTDYPSKYRLPGNNIGIVYADKKGNIWVGYFRNVYYKDGILVASKYNGSTWEAYTTSNNILKDYTIKTISTDSKGNTWLGSNGGGIFKFDGIAWVNYTTADGLLGDYINTIGIDNQDNVWVGMNKGISKFDGKIWTNYNKPIGISSIAFDKEGNKWFGYVNGAIKYNGVEWTNYTNSPNGTQPLCTGFFNFSHNVQVLSINIDTEGNKWFGTSSGVSRLSTLDPVEFSISPKNYEVGIDSGSVSFQVKSNAAWVVKSESSWCKINQKGNGGNSLVTVDYSPHYQNGERVGTISIDVAQIGIQHVTVTQKTVHGINKEDSKQIKLFPNPANNVCRVIYDNLTQASFSLSIYNLLGVQVHNQICNKNINCDIDVTHLSVGCYYIKIESGAQLFSKKLIISR